MRKLVFFIMIFGIGCTPNIKRDKLIKEFVAYELKCYPESRLKDLYKSYFQDAFGPGHLIPDTLGAGRYLEEEMKNAVWKDTLLWQGLGVNHDYYRVNLILIKNGKLPRNVLLEGMVESAQLARKPEMETWKQEWEEVKQVIREIKPDMPGWDEDVKNIDQLLEWGEVMSHHSQHFINTYQPHYRIVHRTVFERWKGVYF